MLAGKALAVLPYLIAALLAFLIVGELAGGILWGFHPLTNGTLLDTLALQGLSGVGAVKGIGPYLLVNQFTAWHGFFETPTNWGPIVRCLWTSTLYAIPPLIAAWVIFQRRDVDT